MRTCCQQLDHLRDADSPFDRIVGTGWYDGLLSGFAACSQCGRAYWFAVLGWAASSSGRVYTLMPLEQGDYAHVVAAMDPLGRPRLPVWVPIWKFLNADQQVVAERQVDSVIARAGLPQYVVYSDDLAKRIALARELSSDDDRNACAVAARGDEAPSSESALADWLAFVNRLPNQEQ